MEPPRPPSRATSQHNSFVESRTPGSESKLRASIQLHLEEDAKLEAMPREELVAIVKTQRGFRHEVTSLSERIKVLEKDLASAQADSERLVKELAVKQTEHARKLAFLEQEKILLANTIAGQGDKAGHQAPSLLPQVARPAAATAKLPSRDGSRDTLALSQMEDTTEFELLEGLVEDDYITVHPHPRPAAPKDAASVAVAIATAVDEEAKGRGLEVIKEAEVSVPPAPTLPVSTPPQPPVEDWVAVRTEEVGCVSRNSFAFAPFS